MASNVAAAGWPCWSSDCKAEKIPASVINASISGDTTSGGRSRLAALLAQHRPTHVMIELGGNDALRGLPLELTQDNLTCMTQAAQKAGAKVLLIGMQVPPNYGTGLCRALCRAVCQRGKGQTRRAGAVFAQRHCRSGRDPLVSGRPHPPQGRGAPHHAGQCVARTEKNPVMSLNTLPATEVIARLHEFDTVIDARSEGEFAEDHLPGAVNWPTLNNEERRDIGTLYKQVNAFEAKKRGAAIAARNIAAHIEREVIDKPKDWQPLAYCWRGGQAQRLAGADLEPDRFSGHAGRRRLQGLSRRRGAGHSTAGQRAWTGA